MALDPAVMPLPVRALYRAARNASDSIQRHHKAYWAWEASVRLAVALAPPADTAPLAQPSVGLWARATTLPDIQIKDVRLLKVYQLFCDIGSGRIVNPETVTPRRVVDELAAYRNRVIGHGATRNDEFYAGAGEKLVAGLEAAWEHDVFWPRRASLVYVKEIKIDSEGRPMGQLMRLDGDVAMLDADPAEVDGALPQRLYVDDGKRLQALHPWLIFHYDGTDELVYFFDRRARQVEYQDLVRGVGLKGDSLERLFPTVRNDVTELFRKAPPHAPEEKDAEPAAASEPLEDRHYAPIREAQGGRLGRWTLHQQRGQGAFGAVFAATDEEGNEAAVKVFYQRETDEENERARRRFLRGPEALRALAKKGRHPNIVTLVEDGSHEKGTPWYAMNLVHGDSLDRAQSKVLALPVRQRLEIFFEICDAMEHAHRVDLPPGHVFHRDLTPSNILLDESTKPWRPVICDFDMAFHDERGDSMTKHIGLGGKAPYVPPEQLSRMAVESDDDLEYQRQDPETRDLWSVGMLLLYLLTGKETHSEEDRERFVEAKLEGEDVRIRTEVRSLLGRWLANKTSLRPASMKQIIEGARRLMAIVDYVEMHGQGEAALDEERIASEVHHSAEATFSATVSEDGEIAYPDERHEPGPRSPATARDAGPDGATIRGRQDTYRIVRTLGEGGLGKVSLAVSESSGEQVAIKYLKADLIDPEDSARARFEREIEVLRDLRNYPGIVRIQDFGLAEDGAYFLVMEHVETPTLDRVLARSRSGLPQIQAVQIAISVLTAIAPMHRHGYLHRDIKPSNICYDERNQSVRLLDFGLSKPLQQSARFMRITGHGGRHMEITGTPHYMSPEQVFRPREADSRSDLYAVGITLYELLAGRPPFLGVHMRDIIAQQEKSAPPAIEHDAEGNPVSYRLQAVLNKALAKDMSSRYQSADEFKEGLFDVLHMLTKVNQERQPLDDRFRIVRKIGQGGNAEVFEAEDREGGANVAIKVVREESSDWDVETLVNEADRALNHDNIVRVVKFGTFEGRDALVMELMEGGNVEALLGRSPGSGMTRDQFFPLVIDVARGLHHAHQRGIVHRDVKPSNMLRTEDGRTKLCDFGIAKPFTIEAGGVRGSKTLEFKGTSLYSAPEQYVEGGVVGPGADIYALGVCMYEFLSGSPPFCEGVLALQHLKSEPPPLRVKQEFENPDALCAVVERCLMKDPEHRYRSMKELAQALSRVADRPPQSHPHRPYAMHTLRSEADEDRAAITPRAVKPRSRPRRVGLSPLTFVVLGGLAAWLGFMQFGSDRNVEELARFVGNGDWAAVARSDVDSLGEGDRSLLRDSLLLTAQRRLTEQDLAIDALVSQCARIAKGLEHLDPRAGEIGAFESVASLDLAERRDGLRPWEPRGLSAARSAAEATSLTWLARILEGHRDAWLQESLRSNVEALREEHGAAGVRNDGETLVAWIVHTVTERASLAASCEVFAEIARTLTGGVPPASDRKEPVASPDARSAWTLLPPAAREIRGSTAFAKRVADHFGADPSGWPEQASTVPKEARILVAPLWEEHLTAPDVKRARAAMDASGIAISRTAVERTARLLGLDADPPLLAQRWAGDA